MIAHSYGGTSVLF